MDHVLITHNDFDGVTCAVIFKTMWPDGVVYIENYDTVNGRLRESLWEHPGAELYITDISPEKDPELIKALDNRPWVYLFDHHKTSEWLSQYGWATIVQNLCGAKIFYKWLVYMHGILKLQPLQELVRLANDYDLWKHESPHSKELNRLLYIYGHDRFINRFVQNPDVALTENELLMLEIEREKEAEYVEHAGLRAISLKDDQGRPYALCFAERYQSQVGHFVLGDLDPDNCQYVAIVSLKTGTVSLRSRPGVDVSEIAKTHGGGGHAQAAGFPLPDGFAVVINELIFKKGA